MFNKIIVVCVANICRSPIGARLLQQRLPHKLIASAGIAAEKSHMVGKPADPFSIAVSIEHGVNLNCHRSQQLTEQMCQEYDLILVMEKGHISAVTDIAPTARGKTMLLGQWIGPKEIPDPYRQSKEAFDFAYQLIDQASSAWVEKLK